MSGIFALSNVKQVLKKTRDFLNFFKPGTSLFLKTEKEWESTFDAINSAIWIIDTDYRILKSNRTAEKIFNLKTGEMIGKKCYEIVHGSTSPIPECPISKARDSIKRELREIKLNNTWFEVVVDPIFDDKGNFRKAVHIVTDITAGKQLNERLTRSETILSNTERLAKTGGWEWDNVQKKMFWTKELYRLHGFDPSWFEPGSLSHIKASLNCYSKKDRKILLDGFTRCIEKGEPYDLELEFTRVSGEKIWIRTAGQPVWKGEKVEKVTGHLLDITKFKKARDEIKEHAEQINRFFDAIEDAIFIHPFREEGFSPFVKVNRTACSRYGYTNDEMLALSAPDITQKANSNSHKKRDHRQELYKKKHLIFEAVHIKKSGETFPVEINSNIFHHRDKPYILAVVRDITNRKKNEEKREQLISELQQALENIKTLKGLLPICSYCKKIRDDKGYWKQLESYIEEYSDAAFSHGMCPDCTEKIYGKEDWYIEMKRKKDK